MACGSPPHEAPPRLEPVDPSETTGNEEPVETPLAPGELRPVRGRVEQAAGVSAPLIEWLSRLFAAPPEEQERMIDWDRVTLVRSAAAASLGGESTLTHRGGLGVGIPPGCEPAFVQQDGYGLIAFPPPMNDMTDEAAALVGRGVEALQEGSEILVLCNFERLEQEEGEDGNVVAERRVVEAGPLLVLNVRAHEGAWRVQAWALLGGREEMVSP